MKYSAALLGLTLCLSPLAATAAAVYKTVDSEGNVTYTDDASSNGEKVDVKPVPTITLPKKEQVQEVIKKNKSGNKKQQSQTYDSVTFDAPANESAFWSGGGAVGFTVSSSPALRKGHQYEVTLDDQPIGQNKSGQFTVDLVDRGTHEASVNIIGPNGKIIQSGNSISFTVHRPSTKN